MGLHFGDMKVIRFRFFRFSFRYLFQFSVEQDTASSSGFWARIASISSEASLMLIHFRAMLLHRNRPCFGEIASFQNDRFGQVG